MKYSQSVIKYIKTELDTMEVNQRDKCKQMNKSEKSNKIN